MKYLFFYDESEHSRKLTKQTLNADNFALNFVASIIGYLFNDSKLIEKEYSLIEEKYKKVFCVDELKSTIISRKKYKAGFSTFNSNDIDLIEDIINFCIKNDLMLYVTVQNKIHFIIIQLLKNYHNTFFFDADAMSYSVTKLICMYKPYEVISAIYDKDMSFVLELKKFCIKLLSHNGNEAHKIIENSLLEQLIALLDDYSHEFKIDWEYSISFYGFKKYLVEQNIGNYLVYIDKEGIGNTLNGAQSEGINSIEIESNNSYGVRIADFIAGLVSRFIGAIDDSISYKSIEDNKQLKYLDKKWFEIDERRFNLYKNLQKLLILQNNSWDKTFCSLYADEFMYFISLVNYISSYDSYDEFIKCDKHQEYVNACAIQDLKRHFEIMSNKLSIDPVSSEDDSYINQRGAVCYKDYNKHKCLMIDDTDRNYYVLSVGFFGKMEKACVTIQENGKPVVYLLPNEMIEWAFNCVALANRGEQLFPSNVKFIKHNGKYSAELL